MGQKRIQAELARLGFQVSARAVAKYMRGCRRRGPTGTWREFLTRHASNMWACDFFCVPTVLFQTLHVFFVIRLANREVLHVAVTRHPTADRAAQQIVECCAWDRAPPRFLIHDRDSRYGANFDRRVRSLGIRQVRTPFRSPRANAIAERWVRSARSECLDHLIVFSEANLRRVLSAYVAYYNRWRPHRSLGQAVPCGEARPLPRQACRKIVAEPVLGGLHHIYRAAARRVFASHNGKLAQTLRVESATGQVRAATLHVTPRQLRGAIEIRAARAAFAPIWFSICG